MGPLLLLHGFLGSAEDFAPLLSRLPPATVSQAPDWPGHGRLSSLRSAEDYSPDAHARIVSEWISSVEEPGTLLGYSMGGRLLQHALAGLPPLGPEWRVVLVSCSAGIDDPAEAANRRAGDAAAARLLREGGMEPFLRYWHNQTMFQPMMGLPPERLRPILARRTAADPEGLARSLESVGPGSLPSTRELLPRLRCRVDVVAGGLDGKYAALAREMAAAIPGGRVRLVPEAGHALHLEQPDRLAEVLLG